eukprot:tig00020830_g14508.t1
MIFAVMLDPDDESTALERYEFGITYTDAGPRMELTTNGRRKATTTTEGAGAATAGPTRAEITGATDPPSDPRSERSHILMNLELQPEA